MAPTEPESTTERTNFPGGDPVDTATGEGRIWGFAAGDGMVAALVGFSVFVSVYHLWTHESLLVPTLIGQWLLLILALAFGFVGYYTLTNVGGTTEHNTVGRLASIGYLLAGLASTVYGPHHYLTPETGMDIEAILFEATFVALVGGIAGAFVGFERARRERNYAELEETTKEIAATRTEIRIEKRRFESLFQNAPSAIVDLQYSGGKLTIERANAAFEELFGRPSGDVADDNLFEVVSLQDPATEDEVAAHVEGDAIYDGEVTVEQSGERQHYKLRVIPYDVGKEGERAYALYTDVTELRRTRKELERSVERLEESNERLQQFAYAASHDLQEPLRMVSSYLKLLEDRYADDLDKDAEEFIDFAVDGAERMREMIDGLLTYSRVQTEGDPFETVNLRAVLDNVREDLQFKIEASGAEVTADSLPRVEGDENQLRQVLQNLLENAIEYSGDEPPRVHVGAEPVDGGWVISVTDEGIGIDQGHADRIFEVFERLHSHEDHQGTGIGLALCERIVERHGGEMWVDSEPGEGATFSFSIPDSPG